MSKVEAIKSFIKKIGQTLLCLALLPWVSASNSVSDKVVYNVQFIGDSMRPTLTPGIQKVTTVREIKVGEIYCYRPDYRNFNIPSFWNVCHRLVDVIGDSLQFKGDNNLNYDPLVHKRYVAWQIVN